MAFSEALKTTVRRRAHLCCCVCHRFGVEVHHIVPELEGGSDTDENAAPLCPSCHETYGANPQKRRLIREARDLWVEICKTSHESYPQELVEIAKALKELPTKADLERIAVRNVTYILGGPSNDAERSLEGRSYSFAQPEFIHPLIVRELLGWLSDPRETILAVDLCVANRSKCFFGEFSIGTGDGRRWVKWTGGAREEFIYAHIGTSPSGVEMVECYERTGGTGVFGTVGLFALECDRALGQDRDGRICTHTRVVLKTLGSIALGDRYYGTITYQDGLLEIGPDEGHFHRGTEAAKTLPVQ